MNSKSFPTVLFAVLMVSVFSVPRNAAAQNATSAEKKGQADTVKLLQLMDKDRNGKVSRAEFLKFMNAEFDLLDVNKDGQLDPDETAQLHLQPVAQFHATTK